MQCVDNVVVFRRCTSAGRLTETCCPITLEVLNKMYEKCIRDAAQEIGKTCRSGLYGRVRRHCATHGDFVITNIRRRNLVFIASLLNRPKNRPRTLGSRLGLVVHTRAELGVSITCHEAPDRVYKCSRTVSVVFIHRSTVQEPRCARLPVHRSSYAP